MRETAPYEPIAAAPPDPVAAGNAPVIRIRDLCKSFGDHVVLDNFDLDVGKEENVVILGKSGVGKSVLIKCIVGLLRPDSGTAQVFGENVAELDHDALDR